jgi:hypothetical protein
MPAKTKFPGIANERFTSERSVQFMFNSDTVDPTYIYIYTLHLSPSHPPIMSLVTSQTLPVFLFFSAFTFLLQKTGEPPQSGIPQPADAKEAEREIMEEEADVKFAAAEDGLQRPLNGARPALIIVMGPASW